MAEMPLLEIEIAIVTGCIIGGAYAITKALGLWPRTARGELQAFQVGGMVSIAVGIGATSAVLFQTRVGEVAMSIILLSFAFGMAMIFQQFWTDITEGEKEKKRLR
jgi:hypothetical protein